VSSINASGCPSTGWVTAFYIGRNWFHSVFPQKSQDEVLAERPYQLRSVQIAPTLSALKVAGGYEITEQQSWSSGITHATYVFFTAVFADAIDDIIDAVCSRTVKKINDDGIILQDRANIHMRCALVNQMSNNAVNTC
jgi:hypothetical protein